MTSLQLAGLELDFNLEPPDWAARRPTHYLIPFPANQHPR